jgi:hypothetical protein
MYGPEAVRDWPQLLATHVHWGSCSVICPSNHCSERQKQVPFTACAHNRLTTGHHNMPAGGLFGVLPAFAGSLRTLHLHLGAPGLTSRDIVGLGRLTQLRELTVDVQITAEVRTSSEASRAVLC